MSLATIDNYLARFGPIPDGDIDKVVKLLGDASSKVREVAQCDISAGTYTEQVDTDGSRSVWLRHVPVTAVASVTVDDEEIDATDWRFTAAGALRRRWGRWSRHDPVVVTYTAGWNPVPDWIVGLICSMVWDSLRPAALAGEQSVTTGSQTVSYVAARANLWVPTGDLPMIRGLKGRDLA